MKNVFLISPDFIRKSTNISSNMQDKFLESAIRETQDIDFQEIVGEKLYNKLIELVKFDKISQIENHKYKKILDIAKYFLSYSVISRICVIASIKLDNIGANQTEDDKVKALSVKDIFTASNYYANKADHYKKRLQDFLRKNKDEYDELSGCFIDEVSPNLNSAFTISIGLGGARGKRKG